MPKMSRIAAGAIAGGIGAYVLNPVPSLQQGALLIGGIIIVGEIAMDMIEPYVAQYI